MAAPKPEEISHPPMDQLQGLEYCIDSNPSWGMPSLTYCIFHSLSLSLQSIDSLFCSVHRGDDSSGFPALHFSLRNCGDDSFIPRSFDGWE